MKKIVVVLVSLMVLNVVACRQEIGTEGGNPESPVNGPSSPAQNDTNTLIAKICEKRNACLNIADASCIAGVGEQNLMTLELGINPPYQNLNELILDQNAVVLLDENELSNCTENMSTTSCVEAIADGIWNVNSLSSVHEILRQSGSCSKIYRFK